MSQTNRAQGRFPSFGETPEHHNTTSQLGEAFFLLAHTIAAGVLRAGFPQRPGHSMVFAHLDIDHGSRLSDMAIRAGITPQAMADVVNDLQQRGYVERRPDPRDGRAKLIVLTDRGQQAARAGFESIQRVEAMLEDLLGERALRQLRESLARIIAGVADLREGSETAAPWE
jgi:DNA-binding MarR family transcriptional regulator